MRILSIDPGSSLGWASNATGRLEFGTENFHIKNGESSGNRWRRFGDWLNDVAGLKPIVMAETQTDRVKAAVEEFRKRARAGVVMPANMGVSYHAGIDLIVYERAIFSPKARAAAEIAAGFTTRLEEHCERFGLALQPVGVSTLKGFALPAPPRPKRKKGDPILPRWDQGKDAMIAAAKRRLCAEATANLADPRITIEHVYGGLGEHEADALWLYWYALSQSQESRRTA